MAVTGWLRERDVTVPGPDDRGGGFCPDGREGEIRTVRVVLIRDTVMTLGGIRDFAETAEDTPARRRLRLVLWLAAWVCAPVRSPVSLVVWR
jgi:hypothetical protein